MAVIVGEPGETYVLIEPGVVVPCVLPVPLHQLLQLALKIDVNIHFSLIHNTLGLVSYQFVGVVQPA